MTPEMAINITRLSVAFSFCWPVPASSSKGRVVFMKIVLVVTTISGFVIVLLLMYGAYVHFGDLILTSKCVCLTMCVSQFVVQTIICLVKYETLQHVVDELMTYVKQAQQYERDIFCTYIDKCNRFYGGYIAVVYTTLIAFLLGPLIVPVPFPLDAEYPFSVNYTPVYVILYFHQAFICFQSAGHTCMSLFAALLLFFTVARFECLAMEFEKSRNIDMLIVCIKKQLYLRRYEYILQRRKYK
ncbi:hypothetical protein K0M31_002123 [Melipona bicolor]|uniref:Odorant receptor n=1 Tax=Melipona bicolor TaxID=60889 RepID=A0AA40GGZ5_9HYME|nr:hypothetical protein K0M31_002123 [Melipona bicolor]